MTDQLNLFEMAVTPYGASYAPARQSVVTSPVAAAQHSEPENTQAERFAAWIGANPKVLEVFIEYSLREKAKGRTKIGGKRIVEVMRWDTRLPTTGDGFKINNNWVSRLVRLAIATCPELDGLFELRELRS